MNKNLLPNLPLPVFRGHSVVCIISFLNGDYGDRDGRGSSVVFLTHYFMEQMHVLLYVVFYFLTCNHMRDSFALLTEQEKLV